MTPLVTSGICRAAVAVAGPTGRELARRDDPAAVVVELSQYIPIGAPAKLAR